MRKQSNPKGAEEHAASSLMLSAKPDYSPKNLRALRRSLNMTQAELAKRAKVKQSTVSFFENGNEEKAGPGARARIAGVLLQAEFDHSIGKYGAPSADEKIRQLEGRIVVLERQLQIANDYMKQVQEEKKELLGMLGWRVKKTVEDSEQVEAEKKLMDKIGAEKIPLVEEEEFRSELAAHHERTKKKP